MYLIYCTIIWLILAHFSYFLAKFTTIGSRIWFGDAVFSLENFARFKLKSEKLAKIILGLSYSKAFICRPCHTFWICLLLHCFIFGLFQSAFVSLFAFFIAEKTEIYNKENVERQKQRAINRDNIQA